MQSVKNVGRRYEAKKTTAGISRTFLLLLLPLLLLGDCTCISTTINPSTTHPPSIPPTNTATILLIAMVCNRRRPIILLTCRIHNWSLDSELCSSLRMKSLSSCLQHSKEQHNNQQHSNNQLEQEFLLDFDVSRTVPIIVDEEQVGIYILNLLLQPQDSAQDFCHLAAGLLNDRNAYNKKTCVRMTTARFQHMLRNLSIQPLVKRSSSEQGLPPAILLTKDIDECHIPKILHQTWKTRRVPEKFQHWRKSWLDNHPSWHVHPVWDDDDNLHLVRKHFPELEEVYNNFSHLILRVDFVRYLMMYVFGGVYADLDLESLRPMDSLLQYESPHVVLGVESSLGQILDISFIASVPGHLLWLHVARTAIAADGLERIHDVLQITGNRMFTRVVNQQLKQGMRGVKVYDLPTLYAPVYIKDNGVLRTTDGYILWKKNASACRCGSVKHISNVECQKCSILFPASHVVHHETGTWVKSYWKQ